MGTAGKAYFVLMAVFVLVIGIFLYKKSHHGEPGAKGWVETINTELAKLGKFGPTDPDKFEKPKGAPAAQAPVDVASAAANLAADTASGGVAPGAAPASATAPQTPASAAMADASTSAAATAQAAAVNSAPTPGSMGDTVRKIREKSEQGNKQLENSLNQ